jgi:Family of unknown function (DUF6481)
MNGYKQNGFLDRRATAEAAKKAMLERFRAQPGADDPAVAERQRARQLIVEAREARTKAREEARITRERELAEQKARDEALAAQAAQEAAELAEREEREMADREVALQAAKKAERDARYAARKKRKK